MTMWLSRTKFRPQASAGKLVNDLSDSDKELIYRHIDDWAMNNSVDLRQLYHDQTVIPSGARDQASRSDNALQRLIEAQDHEVKRRIKIPGDIASLLMEIA